MRRRKTLCDAANRRGVLADHRPAGAAPRPAASPRALAQLGDLRERCFARAGQNLLGLVRFLSFQGLGCVGDLLLELAIRFNEPLEGVSFEHRRDLGALGRTRCAACFEISGRLVERGLNDLLQFAERDAMATTFRSGNISRNVAGMSSPPGVPMSRSTTSGRAAAMRRRQRKILGLRMTAAAK